MTDIPPPNIFDFKQPVDFLRAYYALRKALATDFTIRKWSVELTMRPEVLFAMVKGKKAMTVPVVGIMSKAMGLDAQEQAYFEAMVKHDTATNLKDKRVLGLVMAELAGVKGSKSLVEDTGIFTHWVHMAILSIVAIEGLHCTKASVLGLLLHKVSEDVVSSAIDRLLELGLIRYDHEGGLKNVFDHATTKNDAFKTGVHQYYEHVSELAKSSLNTPVAEREFQCFTLPIAHSQVPLFKETIRQFRAKVDALATGVKADQVYQFNLQFFPLTETFSPLKVDAATETHPEMG